MDVTESSSAGGSRGGGSSDGPLSVKPLTRNGYRRLEKVEQQIAGAMMLDGPAIVERAQQRDQDAADFLAPEALVYFIRDAIVNGEERTRDGLIRELLERCIPYFRGRFRGFSREDREDLQGEVLRMIVENLFSPDDRSDFMQVRFWTYLKRRCIDASGATFRHTEDTESLETGFFRRSRIGGEDQARSGSRLPTLTRGAGDALGRASSAAAETAPCVSASSLCRHENRARQPRRRRRRRTDDRSTIRPDGADDSQLAKGSEPTVGRVPGEAR